MAHNILCWTDIPVTDLPRAQKFYAAVLAAPIDVQKHDGYEFAVLPHAHEQSSGCLAVCKDNQPGRTGPLIYLSVEGRLAEAVEIAARSGGEVLEPKQQIGPYGFRAVILDTEGNRIALHSYKG